MLATKDNNKHQQQKNDNMPNNASDKAAAQQLTPGTAPSAAQQLTQNLSAAAAAALGTDPWPILPQRTPQKEKEHSKTQTDAPSSPESAPKMPEIYNVKEEIEKLEKKMTTYFETELAKTIKKIDTKIEDINKKVDTLQNNIVTAVEIKMKKQQALAKENLLALENSTIEHIIKLRNEMIIQLKEISNQIGQFKIITKNPEFQRLWGAGVGAVSDSGSNK